MLKQTLMIHEVNDHILSLPLDHYILTFDDGLYSQYFYFDRISRIPTPKYFFISTSILATGEQSLEFPDSRTAHEKAFNGNYEDFMNIEQVKELLEDPWVTIGGHGHRHYDLSKFSTFKEKLDCITKDTEDMIKWFDENLNIRPTAFCYPYNNNCNGIYTGKLKSLGFTKFFGSERIPVETLC